MKILLGRDVACKVSSAESRGRSRISERGLFFGKALVLEARGPRGTCPPDFLKRGHRGAPCYKEMYLDLSITSYDNAMLSGSDGQNCQSGGGDGLGGAPIV